MVDLFPIRVTQRSELRGGGRELVGIVARELDAAFPEVTPEIVAGRRGQRHHAEGDAGDPEELCGRWRGSARKGDDGHEKTHASQEQQRHEMQRISRDRQIPKAHRQPEARGLADQRCDEQREARVHAGGAGLLAEPKTRMSSQCPAAAIARSATRRFSRRARETSQKAQTKKSAHGTMSVLWVKICR